VTMTPGGGTEVKRSPPVWQDALPGPNMSTSLCSVRLPPDQVGLTITGQRHGGVSAAKAVEINGLVAKLRAVHGPGRLYQSPGRSLIARAVHH
jgi:hypothetical protein